MPKPKPDKDRPNLYSVKVRVGGSEEDCKAFIHLLQQMEERDLIHIEETPTYYARDNSRGRRGKPLAPKPSQAQWGQAYCSISFAYPDYPELRN